MVEPWPVFPVRVEPWPAILSMVEPWPAILSMVEPWPAILSMVELLPATLSLEEHAHFAAQAEVVPHPWVRVHFFSPGPGVGVHGGEICWVGQVAAVLWGV
jgi:hypothetical protein